MSQEYLKFMENLIEVINAILSRKSEKSVKELFDEFENKTKENIRLGKLSKDWEKNFKELCYPLILIFENKDNLTNEQIALKIFTSAMDF